MEHKGIYLEIIDKLISNPLASVFNHPVDPQELPDYYTVIKNPQDLGTIREKLVSDKYSTPSQLDKDVAAVWSNCARYNGQDSIYTTFAKYLSALYRKYKKKLINTGDWYRRVLSTFAMIDPVILEKGELFGFNCKPMTQSELGEVISLSKTHNSIQDRANVSMILHGYGNVALTSGDLDVDIGKLKPHVQHKLYDYYTSL